MEKKFSKIGEIISEFDLYKLKDVLIKNDAGDWGDEPKEDSIGIIRSTNFTNQGLLDLTDVAYRSLKPKKREEKKLYQGEILIERSGGSDTQPVGRVGLITNDIAQTEFAFANFIQRIAVDDTIQPEYLFYCLQQMYEMGVTASMQYQTTGIRNLDWKLYTKSVLPKPPKPEQRTIASILSKVDEAIAATKNSIAKAERLKKSLMQNLLTGKLKPDGTWRKDDEFYKDEKLGNVPIGWKYDKLGKLISKITDGEHISPDMQDRGEYIVSAEDVFDDGVHFEKAKYVSAKDCMKFRKRCDPEFGDVLIVSRGASVGRTCKVQTTNLFCMMGSVILIKPDNSVLINDFISLYLKTYEAWKELRRLSGSSAQQAIYLAHLKKMRIMFPTDVTEQEKIAKSFEGVEKTIFQKLEKLQKLERLKKALMQNLLTGKVRVKAPKEQLKT